MTDPTRDHPLASLLQHADWLRGLTQELVRDGNEAEDVFQETVLASGLLTGRDQERPWIAGVARNIARSRRRHEAGTRAREERASRPESAGPTPAQDVELLERQQRLLAEIERLPEQQRRAILARFYDGLAPRKIAATEGVSVSTVNSRIQRGLGALRAQLDASFGDRRAWAAWIAPLGVRARAASAVSGWAVAAGAALIVAMGGAAASLLAKPGSPPSPSQDLAVAPPPTNQVSSAAPAALSPPPSRGTSTTSRAPVGTRPAVVTVLEDGAPVAGAEVIALSVGDLTQDDFLAGAESLAWERGARFIADGDGRAVIDVERPFLALASTQSGVGAAGVTMDSGDTPIELEGAPRWTVEVLDADGRPLADGAEEGLGVRVYHLVRASEDDSQPVDMYDMEGETRYVTHSGRVRVQHPWLGSAMNGEAIGPTMWQRAWISGAALDFPGAAEFEPRAASIGRWQPFAPDAKPETRTLRLPPTGSLSITVVQPSGERADIDGTLSLWFDVPPTPDHPPARYVTEVRGGVAAFPRFAIGSRPFHASIFQPDVGARWSFDGEGPAGEHDRASVSTVREPGPLVRARLIDASGAAVSEDQVRLLYSRATAQGPEPDGSVRASSQANGEIAFELPSGAGPVPPLRILAARRIDGVLHEACATLDVADSFPASGGDVGDVRLRFEAPVTVRGHVAGAGGGPLAGLRVELERPGRYGLLTRTGDDGSFALTGVLGESASLVVCDEVGPFRTQRTELSDELVAEPLYIELSTASTFVARIDRGSFPEFSAVYLFLRREDGPGVRFTQLGQDGRFEEIELHAGTYTAEIVAGGNAPIARVFGVVVPEATQASDPRIDAIRLDDHFRRIEVTVDGEDPERPPSIEVTAHAGEPGRSCLYRATGLRRGTDEYLLPRHVPAKARFELHDGRAVVIDDVTAIGDRLNLSFPKTVRVDVTLEGEIQPGWSYVLIGAPGTEAEGARIHVGTWTSRADVPTETTIEFPVEGSYTLYAAAPTVSMQGGPSEAASARATEATLEVLSGAAATLRLQTPGFEAPR